MAAIGVIAWPLILPIALLSRLSDFLFVSASQLLALVPYGLGVIFRYEFYRFSLRRCGRNVAIDFGTVLRYRDVSLGDNVLIGMYVTVDHCDFGSWVLVSDGCRFLSGARYHDFSRRDMPIALQGGELTKIVIGDDCWIGAGCTVMADVGQGSVIGAGAVVTRPVPEFSIAMGVPARVTRVRT
jgi:acetyltransferase-like isoleucine patch superfamily enzyme